jgi:dihydropteroate synthase
MKISLQWLTALSKASAVVNISGIYSFFSAFLLKDKITIFNRMFTINCKGTLLYAERPLVMGIINTTPDSFYAGSRFTATESILDQATYMLTSGADILDIGGQSSRPGSITVGVEEELRRVIPGIKAIRLRFPDAIISIDTYQAAVAEAAIEAGASIVNDISGGDLDKEMIATVAKHAVPFIVMHMKGNPEHMQELAQYQDVVMEVLEHLSRKVQTCQKAGIKDVIIDPGFGFAKTIDHNFELLSKMETLQMIGAPILAGLSRKSMIYKTLGITADEALNGTIALNMLALAKGAGILRVHDVKEARQTIELFQKLQSVAK